MRRTISLMERFEDFEDPAQQRRWAKEVATIVDPLLADVWAFAWAHEDPGEREDPVPPVSVLLRMAYLQGYRDALEEPQRGELFARLGVEVPDVRKPPRPATRARRSRGSSSSSGT